MDGAGVRGAVPQRLHLPAEGEAAPPVDIMFRPARVFENATVAVRSGEQEVLRKKSRILTPGEMAVITLSERIVKSLSSKDIMVEIVPQETEKAV